MEPANRNTEIAVGRKTTKERKNPSEGRRTLPDWGGVGPVVFVGKLPSIQRRRVSLGRGRGLLWRRSVCTLKSAERLEWVRGLARPSVKYGKGVSWGKEIVVIVVGKKTGQLVT